MGLIRNLYAASFQNDRAEGQVRHQMPARVGNLQTEQVAGSAVADQSRLEGIVAYIADRRFAEHYDRVSDNRHRLQRVALQRHIGPLAVLDIGDGTLWLGGLLVFDICSEGGVDAIVHKGAAAGYRT